MAFTYNIQSVVTAENSAWSIQMDLHTYGLYIFHLNQLERCMTLSDIFQDFPGPGIFVKKRTLQEAWENCI